MQIILRNREKVKPLRKKIKKRKYREILLKNQRFSLSNPCLFDKIYVIMMFNQYF